MSEDFLMTEWKDSSNKIDGERDTADGTDVVLGLQQTSSPVILKPPLPSTVQQPYQSRRKNIGGQDLQGVSPNGDVAFHSTTETSKLLDLSSSSSSESDLNLQIIPPKRKVRFKRKLRPLHKAGKSKSSNSCRDDSTSSGQSCCCCTGGEGLGALAFVLVFCALGTLMWFHYELSSRLDALQKEHNNLEAQSKETPQALHDYHIQLKVLETNVTSLAQDWKRINAEIQSLNDAVKQLKVVSTGLQDSIAAAPDIKTLPRTVVSITESVAGLGSKISVLESNVDDLKKGQRQLTDSERELKSEHQQLKASLSSLSVDKETSPREEDIQSLRNTLKDFLNQELVHVAASVDDLNTTTGNRFREFDQHLGEVNDSLSWVSNDLAQLHVYVYQNLSGGSLSSAGKGMDPATLGPALQQEAQHILREVLLNGTGVQSSEKAAGVTPTGSEWKDVLAHTHQVSQAYWALLKELSLSPAEVQDDSALPSVILTKLMSQLAANNTSALQALNSSLAALTLRTEKLEAWKQRSQLVSSSTTSATPTEAAVTSTGPTATESVPVRQALQDQSPETQDQLLQNAGRNGATTVSTDSLSASTPTSEVTVPKFFQKLMSKKPLTPEQPVQEIDNIGSHTPKRRSIL